nr:pre-mRNA-splicing factor CWC22 homolog [Ipomoea batatas]
MPHNSKEDHYEDYRDSRREERGREKERDRRVNGEKDRRLPTAIWEEVEEFIFLLSSWQLARMMKEIKEDKSSVEYQRMTSSGFTDVFAALVAVVNTRFPVKKRGTTSSSGIFIKIFFQELSELLGICLLNHRLNDPIMQESFDSIFAKDNSKNTQFEINFFAGINLGGITQNLMEYLKNMPRLIIQQQKPILESDASESSGSDLALRRIHEGIEGDIEWSMMYLNV